MPGEKVTLVRGDGTLLEATPEQAGRLAILGYRPQTDFERAAQVAAQAKEDYYTEPGQQLSAGLEGLGAGATFGLTDYLLGDDETKNRAVYNPGIRMGSEVVGALAPLLLGGGGGAAGETAGVAETAAKSAPTSLLSRAAKALAPGAEGSLAKAVAAGAIEGGVYGGAGAADRAYLDGEPITAEGVLHGLGWGAVIGGALSAAGHGIEKAGEAHAATAKKAAGPAVAYGTLEKTAGAEYKVFQQEVAGFQKSAAKAAQAADDTITEAIQNLYKARDVAAETGGAIDKSQIGAIRPMYKAVIKAIESGNSAAAEVATEKLSTHLAGVAQKLGIEVPNATQAIEQISSVRAVAKELRGLPQSVDGFAGLSPQKFERVAAALEKARGLPIEQAGAITESANSLAKSLGVDPVSPGDLRSAWKEAKGLSRAEGIKPPADEKPQPSIARRAAGYILGGKTYVAARSAGLGPTTAYAGYRGVKDAIINGGYELGKVRASSLGRIKAAASNYVPAAGKLVKVSAPFASLGVSLYGEKDSSTKNTQDLAAKRVQEIAQFAPTASDTIFRAVEPLSITQPVLAPAIHAAAMTAFAALQELMPKSTGVISALQSIWKPSQLQAATLAKQLEVFHDPVGTAETMLKAGQFDAIKVEALRKMAPNIWQDLRTGVLERITSPDVAKKLSYNAQIGLSTMLDLPIHSSMEPGQIATTQQMFLDRNQPQPAQPRMGQGGGMPNPSDNLATPAQKTSVH